ncbi:MAG: ABC transporter substrate binding protein, partial [Phycisphaeraceae bacterium JB051]
RAYDDYKREKLPVQVTGYHQAQTFSQWKAMVLRANLTADAMLVTLYHTIKRTSQDDTSMSPEEVMKWTVQHSKVPILGLYPFAVRDGAVMGICSSGKEHGYLAAITAMDMIKTGRSALRYPINSSVEGKIMFNLQSARQHHIAIPDHLQQMAILIHAVNKSGMTAEAMSE